MANLHQDVSDYLSEKQSVWTADTYNSTAARLARYKPEVAPTDIYNSLVKEGYSPYYTKIVFINLCSLMDWLLAHGRAPWPTNRYKEFMEKNRQLFRNAYEDKYATITWQEFLDEYQQADSDMRKALALLGFSGCRLCELATFDGTTVVGKGGKRRRVYLPNDAACSPVELSGIQIRRRLRYNPHSYRKLAADQWARSGVDIKTIQKLLGHTSLASTQRYLRPMGEDELQSKLENVWRKAG